MMLKIRIVVTPFVVRCCCVLRSYPLLTFTIILISVRKSIGFCKVFQKSFEVAMLWLVVLNCNGLDRRIQICTELCLFNYVYHSYVKTYINK